MNNITNKKLFIYLLTFFLLWVVCSLFIDKSIVNKYKNIEDNKVSDLFLDKSLDLKLFWRTYNIIKTEYYGLDWIENQDLIDWITAWLVDSLWDKHSEFMTPEVTKTFEDNLTWDFEWIWAVINKNILWVEIDRILKWSPSEKYGLLKGDIIIKAWDIDLKWMDLYDAVNEIKWPAWSSVLLKILRHWESDFITKNIIRQKIKIPSIDSEILDDNIWYISVNLFWELTSRDFYESLNNLKKENIKWLIIDLRNNWWWYLDSAVNILSNFIGNWKKLVVTKYRDSVMDREYVSINNWDIYNWKIIVLINWNSASASEITAWALQDYNKAILVWEKSYWKWSVQQPFDLWDWNLLKLTIAKWFTPNDKNIDWEWIDPDIEILFKKEDYSYDECIKVWRCDEDLKEEDFEIYDRQLEEAKKILLEFIENNILQLTIDNYKKENDLFWTWSIDK